MATNLPNSHHTASPVTARIAIVGADQVDAPDYRHAGVGAAVRRGGGAVVPLNEANGLVFLDSGDAGRLERILTDHPDIAWVQLPSAGVERFAASGVFHHPAVFTCAKGSYAGQVSEHALLLTLACLRNVVLQARTPHWRPESPLSLHGRAVTILGGGGIATELVRLLQPFECMVRVLRRKPEKIEGADETLPVSALSSVLPDTDVLVLALALTPETRHIIGAAELTSLPSHAIVVNIARGPHIDTEALVEALRADKIAAAGLDVTAPEPLPAGHPLWADPRVLITSHCADSPTYVAEKLSERVEENVRLLIAGDTLAGLVDPAAGY